jgi:hypothetical protein
MMYEDGKWKLIDFDGLVVVDTEAKLFTSENAAPEVRSHRRASEVADLYSAGVLIATSMLLLDSPLDLLTRDLRHEYAPKMLLRRFGVLAEESSESERKLQVLKRFLEVSLLADPVDRLREWKVLRVLQAQRFCRAVHLH